MKSEPPFKPKGLPGAEVAKAAGLVNYQDGSIVSREIVKGGLTRKDFPLARQSDEVFARNFVT